jgi:amino acid transporter
MAPSILFPLRSPRISEADSPSAISETGSNEPLLRSSSKAGSRLTPVRFISIDTSRYEKASLLSPYGSLDPLRTPLLTPLRTPKTPSTELNTIPEAATVGRNISSTSAYFLIISRVIGSGIFATPGVIAQSTGSIGLSLLLWLLGAVISACGLAVSLELGCMLPRSGGEKVYLEFIYDNPRFLASTVVAVQAMLLGFTASNCIVFGKYMLFALNIEPTDLAQRLTAAGLIIAVTIIHGRFLKGGIAIQNALGWIKILVIAFMALAGISVLIFKPSRVLAHMHHRQHPFSWENLWKGSEWNFGTLATSFFKVSYAYSGFDNVNNVMDEVKDPVRTLKRVAPLAMITIFIFYLLLNVSYFVVVPLEEIKASGELIAALFFERILGEGFGSRLLPILIALSAAGNVMVTTFAQARVNQQIARQGFLPFSKHLSSSAPYGTPLGGLLVHLIPSLLVILLPPQGAVYSFILEVKGYPAQITTLAIGLGLLWLRRRRPDLRRPFKAWKPAVYLPIFLAASLLLAPFFPPAKGKNEFVFWYGTYALVGIGSVLLAVLYWWIWIRVLPWWGGYSYEEEMGALKDGTIISSLVKVRDLGYAEVDDEEDLSVDGDGAEEEKPVDKGKKRVEISLTLEEIEEMDAEMGRR